MVDKEGREAELLELQKAEEAHRELLLKDRDERNKIAKDLHSLRRCGDGSCRLESRIMTRVRGCDLHLLVRCGTDACRLPTVVDCKVTVRVPPRKQIIMRERLRVARQEIHNHVVCALEKLRVSRASKSCTSSLFLRETNFALNSILGPRHSNTIETLKVERGAS